MTEPSSHYTQVNDLRLHYLEAGFPNPNVPPILLLHGFPTSSHLYRNILPELAKTHRAVALDLPGYGLSDKPLDVTYDYNFFADILDGFLDALDIGDTHLCVHDLGGPVGLYSGLRRPERAYKLVLLNILVYPETSWAVKLFLPALRTPRCAPSPHQSRLQRQPQRPRRILPRTRSLGNLRPHASRSRTRVQRLTDARIVSLD